MLNKISLRGNDREEWDLKRSKVTDILEKIIEKKRARLSKRKQEILLNVMKDMAEKTEFMPRAFKKAISESERISIIAEIKKASPSAGVIVEDFNPVSIAVEYGKAGVDAVSILTEEDFFLGSMEILHKVRNVFSGPILAKDFFIDEYQIYEARAHGADCILLIMKIVDEKTLHDFLEIAQNLGMDCIAEVHDESELDKAVRSGAGIIGINNRNLENFSVDLKTTERLRKLVPAGRAVVSESGIKNRSDVEHLSSLGIDAILVGEILMQCSNISAKLRELPGKKMGGFKNG